MVAILITLVPGPGVPAAHGHELPGLIDFVVKGYDIPADTLSLLVRETGSGQAILSLHPDTPRNPASTIKIVSTLAALEKLGPAYRWPTEVYFLGPVKHGVLDGDLLIKGYGDPYFVTEEFWKMLSALRRQGLKTIRGDLIIDDSRFAVAPEDPGAFDRQPFRTYNVLPNAFLVNFKAAYFHFYPAENGRTVRVQTNPPLPNLKISNRLRLRSGSCTGFQRGIAITIADSQVADHVIFEGRFPRACGHYIISRTVLTPATFAYGVFQALWRQLGGEFSGTVRNAQVPDTATPDLTWHSKPLNDVIRLVNKYSNNVMTRQLLLTMAAELTAEPGTLANGISLVYKFLSEHGLDPASLKLVNGAGLSRHTRVSARLLADVLEYAHKLPMMPEFVSSLAILGVDGTAKDRLRRRREAGNAHIKTGTIDDVAAVAGFVHARSGKTYIVAGMVNHKDVHRGPGEELMNALVGWAYRQ